MKFFTVLVTLMVTAAMAAPIDNPAGMFVSQSYYFVQYADKKKVCWNVVSAVQGVLMAVAASNEVK